MKKEEKNLVKGKRAKSLKALFPNCSMNTLLEAISKLSIEEQELLIKTYGNNYDTTDGFYILSDYEKDKLLFIRRKIKNIINNSKSKNTFIETSQDNENETNRLSKYNIPYVPLTREKELSWIKKSKLSFYYKVDEDTKSKYLSYYFEEFPLRKKRYIKLLEETKSILEKLNLELKSNNFSKNNIKQLVELLEEKRNKLDRLLNEYIEDSKIYRNKFIKNNQRLVASIALKRPYYYSLDELMAEGNLGMFKALGKFNVESGNKFSTYATWWIRQKIDRYMMEQVKTIRIPVHQEEKIIRIKKVTQELSQKLLREPTIEEISDLTGYSEDLIKDLLLYDQQYNQMSSLNDFVREDKESECEMFAGEVDENYSQVETEIFIDYLLNLGVLSNLNDNELFVIKKRFGIDDGIVLTLDYIGKMLNVSRERVRQIERKAIEKIRKVAEDNNAFGWYLGSDTGTVDYQPSTHKPTLEEQVHDLYLNEKKSVVEISKILKISQSRVYDLTNNIVSKKTR